MITFTGYMYNVTSDEWLGMQPETYTFGYYSGHDLIPGTSDGAENVVVPRTDISFNTGNNIGCKFEEHAKRYFNEHAEWPILRLYKTLTEQSYIEWDPAAPNGFNIHTIGGTFRWEHVYIWNAVSDLYKPCVFVSEEDARNLTIDHNVWSGCCLDTSQDPALYVGYHTQSINILSSQMEFFSAAKFLTRVGNRTYTKLYEGPCLGAFIKGSDWAVPTLICPSNNGSINPLPPFTNTFIASNLVFNASGTMGPYHGIYWSYNTSYAMPSSSVGTDYETDIPLIESSEKTHNVLMIELIENSEISVTYMQLDLYAYLTDNSQPEPPPPIEPPSDVDPDDIPPVDDPPTPVDPDDPDPYYDPTSDPDNPDYDPEKDPDSPDYDPDVPHTPFRPISGDSPIPDPDPLPPVDDIVVPPAPPAYVTNNRLLTFYNPVDSELNDLATFLWSPTWSVDTFKKIFANPLDAILGLMVMPTVPATVSTRELTIGNIGTGITMRYFTQQFVDVPCGSIDIKEYYQSYLDYSPYTKIMLILPFIGECAINTDEVMNKTLSITYRFDIATGICVAFVSVDGNVLYTFNGSAVTSIPLSANGWGSAIGGLLSMPIKALGFGAATGTGPVGTLGAAAAISVASMKPDISHTGNITGSAGLMGIQKPYVIINRPRQALPMNQNSYTGYPSFITESLGGLKGYTEVEKCHLEHVPATGEELNEIERLLKEGVLL